MIAYLDDEPPPLSIDGAEARPVPGFSGYYVTADAALYSTRRTGAPRRVHGWVDSDEYVRVRLACADGRRRDRRLHQLVAWAWLEPPAEPGDWLVRHHDGDKQNCAASNLEYGDNSDNQLDRRRHPRATKKRSRQTERAGNHKLTPEQVRDIRASASSCRTLATLYGVHFSTVSLVRRGSTWQGVSV